MRETIVDRAKQASTVVGKAIADFLRPVSASTKRCPICRARVAINYKPYVNERGEKWYPLFRTYTPHLLPGQDHLKDENKKVSCCMSSAPIRPMSPTPLTVPLQVSMTPFIAPEPSLRKAPVTPEPSVEVSEVTMEEELMELSLLDIGVKEDR